MNIFYFSYNVLLNARLLDDKRLIKMILETTQLLSNALFLHHKQNPYKPTHLRHPCTLWASKTEGNWKWLKQYGIALSNEYTKRYNKEHKCYKILISMTCPKMKYKHFFQPPQCMPNQYKSRSATKAYIKYYIYEKYNPNLFKRASKSTLIFWKRQYRILI